MSAQTPVTLTPLTVGGIGEIKNRVILAPLTRGRCDQIDQVPTDINVEYYKQRSTAGLLITEATIISKQGHGWSKAPAIYSDQHVEGWKKVVDAVHSEGAKICLQLWHMGRVTHSTFHGLQPVSASDIPVNGVCWCNDRQRLPYEKPRPLELYEIPAVIEEFRHAAACALAAGFDGVEVHCANGYLLDQFLQSCSNKRTDDYGGSIENRFRLIREVLDAVATVFPSNKIGVRISPNGSFNDMGSEDNFELFTYVMQQLNKYNLAYLHCMDGLAFGFHNKCKVVNLHHVRNSFNGIIIGNCGYSPQSAEGAINTGSVDAISFGRLYLSNPDLVTRIENGFPLSEVPAFPTWYECPTGESESIGYSDYPIYEPKE